MDLEKQRAEFVNNGYCLFEDVIPQNEVGRIKDAVERDVWAHNLLARPTGYVPSFFRFNQEVAPYVTREPLHFAESFFGPHVRISMVSGIVNGSGIPRGELHSDWPYNQRGAAHVLAPYPDAVLHIVTMWMLTDFTAENGGTIVVPGSHKQSCHPLGEASSKPWPGETQLTGKAGTVAAFDARLWHSVAENRTSQDRVAVLVRYAPWWLNLNTLRPGSADHRDIVEANQGKDSTVPPLSSEQFERLPDAVKPLLRYSIG